MNNYIYFDNAATTPLDTRVLADMSPYFTQVYGNPHSRHVAGRDAMLAVDNARDGISRILGCKSSELYFTAGGTEANNWAVKGIAAANSGKNNAIIISAIEHPSVMEAARAMQKYGFDVRLVYPDNQGIVSPQLVEKELKKGGAALVAVMAVNNETGVIQPVKEIYSLCRQAGVHYHCDCVQAAGAFNVTADMADSISLSAHKFYGPKGVGALVIKGGTHIQPLINGGTQERGLRGGTTNVAGVVGFYSALKIAVRDMDKNNAHICALKDMIMGALYGTAVKINGSTRHRVPSNLNLQFTGYENTQVMAFLDRFNIAVSAGSACTAGDARPSHVLTAMGLTEREAASSIRISIGKNNTTDDAETLISAIKELFGR